MPVELTKGQKDGHDQWKIKGIASTGDTDLQGETVDQQGLDISALKAGRGLFNWDHQKGPENILGQIEDAEFIKSDDGKQCLQVEGYLFKEQDRAKAFHNILKSIKKGNAPRVHMSIEGKIMERDNFNAAKIKKARIDKVALTLDPVNPYTFAELCKSLNSPEPIEAVAPVEPAEDSVVASVDQTIEITKDSLESLIKLAEEALLNREETRKALSAGAPSGAPASRTGGEAMSRESLDKEPKNMTYSKKCKKNMLKSVIDQLMEDHPDQNPLELAKWAVESFINKSKGESRD